MAGKATLPINKFDGGVNTDTNARDLQDTEYKIGHNVDTIIVGKIKCPGNWDQFYDLQDPETNTIAYPTQTGYDADTAFTTGFDTIAGFGLTYFNVDRNIKLGTFAEVEGHYIAIYRLSDATIAMFVDPNIDTLHCYAAVIGISTATTNSASGIAQLGDTNYSATTGVDYLYIDGALRIFDARAVDDTSVWAKPIKWYFWEKDITYFHNTASIDGAGAGDGTDWATATQFKSPTTGEYLYDWQFVREPLGGVVVTGGYNNATPECTSLLSEGYVGLVINNDNQTGNVEIGWGKSDGVAETYHFYASYVYDGTQESLAKFIGQATLGGNGQDTEGVWSQDDAEADNDATFLVEVLVRDGAGGAIRWNPRITSVRIYYRREEDDEDILYFIGDYPITSPLSGSSGEDTVGMLTTAGATALKHIMLKGDKTGKGASGPYAGSGTYHGTPPTIFTHGVKSGLNANTISTECKYKTGVILNRVLYVGNIKQKTADSPSAEREYPDRLLKSLPNRFDVLPDNEFIDVAIRDGESIVKLVGYGNRLLQFKENTLYVLAVAGGEEYLEAKYKNMGVRHPNAVTTLEEGVFWVNEFGAYIMVGDKAPINLIDKKINKTEWANFITPYAIVGYYAREKKLFVIGDSSKVADTTGESSDIDTYCFNALVGGWNQQVDVIGQGVNYNSISNIIDYTTSSGNRHMVAMTGDSATHGTKINEYVNIEDLTAFGTVAIKPFNLVTKEFTLQQPHVRKSIYKLYITYRGEKDAGADFPLVFLNLVHKTGTTLIQLDADIAFVSTAHTSRGDVGTDSDWQSAVYVPKVTDRSLARNVYGVQVVIRGTHMSAITVPGGNSGTYALNFDDAEYIGAKSEVPYRLTIAAGATTFTWTEGVVTNGVNVYAGSESSAIALDTTHTHTLTHGVRFRWSTLESITAADIVEFSGLIGGKIDQRFEINDLSLVYRAKAPK